MSIATRWRKSWVWGVRQRGREGQRGQSGRFGAAAGPARPRSIRAAPVPVVVTKVAKKPMPIMIEAVGTVQAIASIQIKPRLDSQIMKVHVEEGALVKEGDMLFELDQRSAEGPARPDRGADPQGPGPGGPGQARLRRATRTCWQGCRHGGHPRHHQTTLKAAEAQLEADEASAGERR